MAYRNDDDDVPAMRRRLTRLEDDFRQMQQNPRWVRTAADVLPAETATKCPYCNCEKGLRVAACQQELRSYDVPKVLDVAGGIFENIPLPDEYEPQSIVHVYEMFDSNLNELRRFVCGRNDLYGVPHMHALCPKCQGQWLVQPAIVGKGLGPEVARVIEQADQALKGAERRARRRSLIRRAGCFLLASGVLAAAAYYAWLIWNP